MEMTTDKQSIRPIFRLRFGLRGYLWTASWGDFIRAELWRGDWIARA
jgi:hypothetical protein